MIGPSIGAALGLAVSLAAQAVATPAAQSPGQSRVAPPTRFERILWTSDAAATGARAAELGFTGVQIGRGADPAKATAAGLGYYLDQPVGKGVLELRDREFVPLRRAYEKGRDPAVLVRPGCYAKPEFVADLAARAAKEARRAAGAGLRFVALADEASATRHDAPLDTCWCGDCLQAFRAFAQKRYRSIDALNAAFGTQYERFEDVAPLSTDQVRRRELGDVDLPLDLRPFAARLDFVDGQFEHLVRAVQTAVAAAVPGVPVGLTGLSAPSAFGGGDPARILPLLTLAEPYDVGSAPALAASFLPVGAHRYRTLFPPAEDTPAARVPVQMLVRAQLADMATHGLAGMVVWNDQSVLAAGNGDEPAPTTPFGRAVVAGIGRIGPVLDACAGAVVATDPIWIVESQPSVRLWWMLDSQQDGMSWPRRLASYERTHSTSQAARSSWLLLLRDLGFQPRFVSAARLASELPKGQPRCVVLPATIALSDRTIQALTSFVRLGGTVLADHSPALYDENLRRRDGGGLDVLFGVKERSWRWSDLRVREGRSTVAAGGAADPLPRVAAGLRAGLAVRHEDGDAFAESRPGRGHAVLLNAPVCDYGRLRLLPGQVAFARELRRRVRAVLQSARCREVCDVRGSGLPTCIERVRLRLRDGRDVLAIRVNALADPPLLRRLAQDGPRPVRLELPAPRRLRHLGGPEVGAAAAAEFDLKLDPFGALFLEVLPR